MRLPPSCRKYGLDEDTVDFIGHALALQPDDSYLDEPAMDTVKRMKVSATYGYLRKMNNNFPKPQSPPAHPTPHQKRKESTCFILPQTRLRGFLCS